ncbi:hypothetical protein L901_17780 [Agrobacterium sp. D14]|nr:hypothetical protein L901_17780 [Agrobacterium sp. D14]
MLRMKSGIYRMSALTRPRIRAKLWRMGDPIRQKTSMPIRRRKSSVDLSFTVEALSV